MSAHLFRFIGKRLHDGEIWVIEDAELHHLKRVLRLKEGDIIEVIDGKGVLVTGKITELSKGAAYVEVVSESTFAAPNNPLKVAFGALNHGTTAQILPQIVELNVDVIEVFYQSHTSQKRICPKTMARLSRIISEASKQCKRIWLPKLKVYQSLEKLLETDAGLDRSGNLLYLDHGASASILTLPVIDKSPIRAVIGGERGLDHDEINLLQKNGYRGYHLGQNVLRSTTAIITLSAILALKGQVKSQT